MLTDVRSKRLLAVPAGHPYVAGVVPPGWEALPDPTEPWWPHPGLEPKHIGEVGDRVDLVHLHFGYEHRSLAQMSAWIDALEDAKLPLVLTVHDLVHPHLADNTAHDRHLDLLMARAAAVITLTSGAAAEIERRWSRAATVIEHPPLVEKESRPRTVPGLVGLSFKNRPNVADPADVLGSVCAATNNVGGSVEVRFDVSAEPAWVETASRMLDPASGRIVVAGPSTESDFVDGLARLHVAVLPYLYGTHSGWLEACRDVGTLVVAPDTGYYHDQWDQVITYSPHPTATGCTLEDAVARALAGPAPSSPSPEVQQARAVTVTGAHERIYDRVLRDQRR